jgi:hypothetical protein
MAPLLQSSGIGDLVDKSGIGNIQLPQTGTLIMFLTVIVVTSVLLLGLVYMIYQIYRKGLFNLDVIILEESAGRPAIRVKDLGRIKTTIEGPEFEFYKERPLVPPSVPDPSTIGPISAIPSELSHLDMGAITVSGEKPLLPWMKNRGARLTWQPQWSKYIVAGQKKRPLIIFLYREGQYMPYEWKVSFDQPAFDVIRGADQRAFVDGLGKLVRRHLLREDGWKKYAPVLAFAGAALVLVIGMVFLYLQNKRLAEVMGDAMSVSREVLAASRSIANPPIQGGPL